MIINRCCLTPDTGIDSKISDLKERFQMQILNILYQLMNRISLSIVIALQLAVEKGSIYS